MEKSPFLPLDFNPTTKLIWKKNQEERKQDKKEESINFSFSFERLGKHSKRYFRKYIQQIDELKDL